MWLLAVEQEMSHSGWPCEVSLANSPSSGYGDSHVTISEMVLETWLQ